MQDKPSLMLAVIALAAAFIVTTTRVTPPVPSSSPAPSAVTAASASPPGTANPITAGQCEAIPAPLKPLCMAVYEPAESAIPRPPDWTELKWVSRISPHVHFALVMVADPGESGDTLRFDRTIETVQNAAEGLNYSFVGYSIPWQEPDQAVQAGGSAGGGGPGGNEPGSMVFRREGETLVVFLVGESAVSGIQRLQFLRAFSYMRVFLTAGMAKVRIVGPNYSGSLDPLRQALDQALGSAGVKTDVTVVSPSATVLKSGEEFTRDRPHFQYHSVVHNDIYAGARFSAYVSRRWWLHPSGVAVLRESSTTFGHAASREAVSRPAGAEASGQSADSESNDLPLRAQFPRGIFRLRNASPEASARALFTPEADSGVSQDKLTMSLRGPRPGRERVPSLAGDQAPVAQESVLLGISSVLRQEGIKFAQIVSSDVYDSIFLAGFLKRAYPQVRPYFLNADLLNIRASELLPLEGSLSVTTFPLIARNQLWAQPAGGKAYRDLRPVSSRFEEGLYNAFRALMLEEENRQNEDLLEYSFPDAGFQDHPPLWLTVIGTNGYWPVALLDRDYVDSGDKLLLRWPGNPDRSAGKASWPPAGEPSWVWSVVFVILVLTGFVLGAMVILAQSGRARWRAAERLLVRWAARPGQSGAVGRAYFAMSACLVLAAMIFAMAGPVWMNVLRSAPEIWTLLRAVAGATAFCVLIAAAASPLIALGKFHRIARYTDEIKPGPYIACCVLGICGFFAFLVLWSRSMASGAGLEDFFFCYRSFDLLNGVNPAMPFLFLSAGLLVLIGLHQTRHAMVAELPVQLPDPGDDILIRGLNAHLEKAIEPLAHPLVSSQLANWLVAAAGLLTIFFLPIFQRQQSLEGMAFDVLHWGTLVTFYSLAVFTWARFLVVWMHLKRPLDRLAAHPLRLAFESLPRDQALCSILRGHGRYGTEETLMASLNALRSVTAATRGQRLQLSLKRRLALAEGLIDRYLHPARAQGAVRARTLSRIHSLLAGTGTLISGELTREWKGGRPEEAKAPTMENEDFSRTGAQFIALQYAAFLGNVMAQLQNLLRFVAIGFFLGISSTLVYAFRSQDTFVWAGTVSFVLLGLPVLVTIVQIERHPLLPSPAKKEDRWQFGGVLGKIVLYFALPLLGVIGAHFPALGRSLVALLQPAMQAIR